MFVVIVENAYLLDRNTILLLKNSNQNIYEDVDGVLSLCFYFVGYVVTVTLQ